MSDQQRGLIEVDVLSVGSDMSEIVIVAKRLRQRLWVPTSVLVLYDADPPECVVSTTP